MTDLSLFIYTATINSLFESCFKYKKYRYAEITEFTFEFLQTALDIRRIFWIIL